MKNIFPHIKNLSIYGFGQLFNLVTPLLVVPYIIAVCGEENFGKTAIAMAVSFFLIVFVDYGSDLIGTKEIAIHKGNQTKLNQIFCTTFGVKFIMLLLVFLISVPVFFLVPFFKREYVLFLFSLTVIVGQFLNPTWFLQGIENVKWITVINLLSKSIYLIAVFGFIHKEEDYIYVNLFWGLGMIISHIVLLILILKKHSFNIMSITFSNVLSQLKEDFSLFWSQIFTSLQMYAPVALLGFFGGNLLAGQYKIIDQVIVIFKTYIFLFFNFVFPKVCFDVENNTNTNNKLQNWRLFNGVNFVFIIISMVLVYIFANPIINYFNPKETKPLVDALRFAVFIPILLAVSIPLKQLVLAYNFKRFYVQITMVMVVFNLVALFFMIQYFKLYSVLYALVASDLLVILFYLYCIRKQTFLKPLDA